MKFSKSFSTGPSVDQAKTVMLLGLASWGFRDTPLKQQLAITRQLGVSLLELSIAGHLNDALQLDASPGDIVRIRSLFSEFCIDLSCTAHGNDFTLPDRDANIQQLENVKKVINIVQQLGGRYLRIFAGFSPAEEVIGARWQTMIDCLKATTDCAAQSGIIPVVETHGGVTALPYGVRHFPSTSSQPEILGKILNEVPGLYVNYDPANLYAVGMEHPEEVYKMFSDRIKYVHLKDFVPVADNCFQPAACGESPMDWLALLNAMSDYTGPALIEYENTADVTEGCERSLNFLKSTINWITGKGNSNEIHNGVPC